MVFRARHVRVTGSPDSVMGGGGKERVRERGGTVYVSVSGERDTEGEKRETERGNRDRKRKEREERNKWQNEGKRER